MNEHDTAMQNPLYEKLSRRFSYSGKTVGEMMLNRAAAASTAPHRTHEDIHGLTAESCITRANYLPRSASNGGYAAAKVKGIFKLSHLSPASMMALALSFVIFTYVFFSGIHHNAPLGAGPDLLAEKAVEAELYEPAADINEIL